MSARHKSQEKRHPLAVAVLLAVALVAVPTIALTLATVGLTLGILFGWIARGLGKT